MTRLLFLILSGLLLFPQMCWSQPEKFHQGPLIKEYGLIADVKVSQPLPKDVAFKVSFDVAKQADTGSVNRALDTAARFINMHVASGLKTQNIELALVIHGSAVKDMANDQFYQSHNSNPNQQKNGNADIINVLQKHGVKFYVCGQSAAYYGVGTKDLIPGVKMSLSAMTAHALLQQQGFTLNPF